MVNRDRKGIFFDKIICIVFAVILCLLVELSARLFYKRESELDKILNVLQQDSLFFWKLKPNLDINFQDVNVRTNSFGLRSRQFNSTEDKNNFRIICLGGSSTFGWGVSGEDTYPFQLEKLLREKYDAKNIEVINAGIIGYTSHQGLLLLNNQILKFNPDVITVSYLVNDVDKHRFYRNSSLPDKLVNSRNKLIVFLESCLEKSKFFKIIKKLIVHLKGSKVKFYGNVTGTYSKNRRVSVLDYKNNLRKIIDIVQTNEIKILLIKMPIGFPFKGEISVSAKKKSDKYIVESLNYANSDNYDRAIVELKKALEYNPYSSKAFYYLGTYCEIQKDFKKAEMYFQKAKEMEFFECAKLSKIYNRAMQNIASNRNVALVDVVTPFEEDSESLFVNPTHDFVHPNAKGHKIISKRIFDALIKYEILPF